MLHESRRDVLIQPYVQSVAVVGERALVFVDGEFTHAMTKSAMLNTPAPRSPHALSSQADARAEVEPRRGCLRERVLSDLGYERLLYARVTWWATRAVGRDGTGTRRAVASFSLTTKRRPSNWPGHQAPGDQRDDYVADLSGRSSTSGGTTVPGRLERIAREETSNDRLTR